MNVAGQRLGVSTSSNAGGATASAHNSEGLASPVLPAAQEGFPVARRRSTLAEESEAWRAHYANGSASAASSSSSSAGGTGGSHRKTASGAGLRLQASSPLAASHAEKSERSANGNKAIFDEEDEDSEAAGLLADDEEMGLPDAERRKRRARKEEETHLDQRVMASADHAGGSSGAVARLFGDSGQDASVMRRSMINVGLILLWYFFSLSISIYNKWMFGEDHLNFPFPLFTTSTHMLVQFTLSSLVLYFLPRFRPGAHNSAATDIDLDKEIGSGDTKSGIFSVVTKWFYLTRLGPCGVATGLDIGLGNMSLKFITLTFFTMCKSSSLAFVLMFAFLFRLETPSAKLVLIIAAMTGGVVMMVSGEVNFDALGFVLIMMSSFFSGFRWALTQILLLRHPATSNPFASIFFLTPIMFVILVALAIPIEGFGPLGSGLSDLVASQGAAVGPLLLLFPGILAFCMTSAEFALLQRTSVVTLSICGIFKEVVTITAAELTYHDPLTPINLSGLAVTVVSIAAYNYIKIQKMRRDANDGADNAAATVGAGTERLGMLEPDTIEMEEVHDDDDRRMLSR